MVFILGYLCSVHVKDVNLMEDSSLVDDFNRCLTFLQGYRSHNHSARKCCKILELVKQEVFVDRTGMWYQRSYINSACYMASLTVYPSNQIRSQYIYVYLAADGNYSILQQQRTHPHALKP
jgi:hypothetical protein